MVHQSYALAPASALEPAVDLDRPDAEPAREAGERELAGLLAGASDSVRTTFGPHSAPGSPCRAISSRVALCRARAGKLLQTRGVGRACDAMCRDRSDGVGGALGGSSPLIRISEVVGAPTAQPRTVAAFSASSEAETDAAPHVQNMRHERRDSWQRTQKQRLMHSPPDRRCPAFTPFLPDSSQAERRAARVPPPQGRGEAGERGLTRQGWLRSSLRRSSVAITGYGRGGGAGAGSPRTSRPHGG